MSDVFILIHALNGAGLVFHIPFAVMQDELDLHYSIFPDIDATYEMYRRLQVRASSALLRIVEDDLSVLCPRDYFVFTATGTYETESGDTYMQPGIIPFATIDSLYDNAFQLCLLESLDKIDTETKIIKVPINVMSSLYENEKEDDLIIYMSQCISAHFDPIENLSLCMEKLTL